MIRNIGIRGKYVICGVAVLILLAVAVIVFSHVGWCRASSENVEPLQSYTEYYIPVLPDHSVRVAVAPGSTIVSTDGITTWEFTDGTNVTVLGAELLAPNGVNTYKQSDESVYTSVGGRTLSLYGTAIITETNYQMWCNDNCVIESVPRWNINAQLDALPTVGKVEGFMSSKGVIMPENNTSVDPVYTADVWHSGSSYMYAYIQLGFIDSIRTQLYTYARLSGTGILSWYESDDVFYVETSRLVIAAKKKTENKWVIYGSSLDKKDFVLINLSDAIHEVSK